MNQYESVITSVGAILREYDEDKMIGAFGFGACVLDPQNFGQPGPVQHCFPLSPYGDEVHDVGGLM